MFARVFFSPEEFARVESHLPEYLRDFCRFGFVTSWRKGEIASLQWEDVDGNQIRLRAANAKNGTGRSVIMTGELAEMIKRRRTARQFKTDKGVPTFAAHVFHLDVAPHRLVSKGLVVRLCVCRCRLFHLREARTVGNRAPLPECEVETRYLGKLFHDLRRSAVRNMVRSGVSSHVAMKISDHKTPSMFKRYDIISEDDLRHAMDRTQAFIAEPQLERQPTLIRQATGGKN